MVSPERIDPPELGRPIGYSNGFLVPPGRALLFVAGQIGWDQDQALVGGGFGAQFDRALANVLAVVRAAGGEAADVVSMRLFVLDKAEYVSARGEIGASWKQRLGRHYPTMALVEVKGLLEPGARVEIEAVAAVPPRQETP